MIIQVTTAGDLRFVTSPELLTLAQLGPTKTRRASRVVPQNVILRVLFRLLRSCVSDDSRCAGWTRRWRCRWLADLGISGGPVLGPYPRREQALAAEVDWLHTHGF